MFISTFEIFKIGIGPSSSHTMGPMKAAKSFADSLTIDSLQQIEVHLYGSLALTGLGHGVDKALILGLSGESAETIDPSLIHQKIESVVKNSEINISGKKKIHLDPKKDFIFHRKENLPYHPNGMRFTATTTNGLKLEKIYYSIGGGFILDEEQVRTGNLINSQHSKHPYPFRSSDQLLVIGAEHNIPLSEIILKNESSYISQETVFKKLDLLWQVMQSCVLQGCKTEGILPGGYKVKRRAPELYQELSTRPELALRDPLSILDWVNLYALAVNEENASFGQVVTAPTNGAAGIIPAVLHYYDRFVPGSSIEGIRKFLLSAAGIGMLYKLNASISGAEVGCQGEVGVASSMAAGALTEVMGGTIKQVENAAEIAMEHHLGMTCDPVGGLVQIPCIERNAMGAIKAINASRIALKGDGNHYISLDKCIETMRQTGLDMSSKYKETSKGGLAVNIPEC